jgi:predicted O-methyltransferase YrrM
MTNPNDAAFPGAQPSALLPGLSEGPIFELLTRWGPVHMSNGDVPVHANPMQPFLNKGIDYETGLLLYNFIKHLKPKAIVELGTFRGYSTSWLLAGAILSAHVCEVHAFEVFKEGAYGSMYYDDLGLDKSCLFYHEIPGGVWNFPDQVPAQIDLLFHDTQHLLGPTQKEMEILLPRIPVGGIVLIDDMLHPDYRPMQSLIFEIFDSKYDPPIWTYTTLPLGHGLGIARRVK